MAEPYRIAFVCTGNICRSPMAEAVLRRILDTDTDTDSDRIGVDSFGTTGWHVGDPADPRAVAALRRRGYDISHRARKWHPDLFATRDLVLAMDTGHLDELRGGAPDRAAADRVRLLLSFHPGSLAGRDGPGTVGLDVPDPYHGGAVAFDQVLDLIEASCRGLAVGIRSTLSRT